MTDIHSTLARNLIDGLAAGSPDGVRAIFAGPADIDDPFSGRHVDSGFEQLVRNWGPVRLGTLRSVALDHVTVGKGGGFCGAEYSLHIVKQGEDRLLNVLAVIELKGAKASKARLYYRRARLDGVQHVRNRILDDNLGLEPYMPALARYQAALTGGDAAAMAETFSPTARFDGHGESTDLSKGLGMGIYEGRDAIRHVLVQMFGIIDHDAGGSESGQHGANIERLNGFTNGSTYVLEFNIIDPNHPTNRVHAGAACYEVGNDGLIREARVYDEAW